MADRPRDLAGPSRTGSGRPGRHTIDPAWRRRRIQREIEDHLSEKILFGGLKVGQIVTVDVEDTGPEAQFTFQGVPKPGEMPGTPPAEIARESKAAAVGTDGHLTAEDAPGLMDRLPGREVAVRVCEPVAGK